MKIFLLIKPSFLTIPLVFKAVEINDKIFIISKYMEPVASLKAALNASSLCFQVDTENHGAILHLVNKISKTFSIDAD